MLDVLKRGWILGFLFCTYLWISPLTVLAEEAVQPEALPIVVSGELPGDTPEIPAGAVYRDEKGQYKIELQEDGKRRFYNHVDGYSLLLPEGVTVQNMTLSGLCAVLASPVLHMEIYREDFPNDTAVQAYLAYSYKGIETPFVSTQNINGYTVQITSWQRGTLQRMENDFPCYTSFDIVNGRTVYNILMKTRTPLSDFPEAMEAVRSFAVMDRTALGQYHTGQNVVPREWNEETAVFYAQYFAEGSPLTWGIFEPSAPMDLTPLHSKEAEVQYDFPILLYYQHIHRDYNEYPVLPILEKAYEEGITLELTLQTNSSSEAWEGNMVYQILNGGYDDFLHKYAAAIAEFGHPVLFRLGNEMNGDWCPYSAFHTSRDTAIYRAFYRYIYEIFREERALSNTIWIWNPNEKAFPDYKWNYETLYYPGDEYVDVVGLTGYNTGTYYAASGEVWRSFAEIYDPIYRKVITYTEKPLMITEFACSSIGGDKAVWVAEMFRQFKQYPRIKVAVWWDGRDMASNGEIARPYFINDNAAAIAIFRFGFNGGFDQKYS